jgi:putative glycosyltransferase (TIGR04348 family)
VKIRLITPAPARGRGGNRTTAERWARLLRELGHRVDVAREYGRQRPEAMIAIHAWRSAGQAASFRARYPERPLVVALAGTDIYRFQESDPETTHRSMALADALVCLHDLVHEAIPAEFRSKLRVIHQSAPPLSAPRVPSRRHFEVLVVGNLREEKDPLRAALAARMAPAGSRLRIVHFGRAHDERWELAAHSEMAQNPRYDWRGEVTGGAVRKALARAHALVLSSRLEGGANVVSEAVAAGVPVIASRVHGNVGLLGADYPGYYALEETAALAALLRRAEEEPGYLTELERHCARLEPLFRPEREREAWAGLLRELAS